MSTLSRFLGPFRRRRGARVVILPFGSGVSDELIDLLARHADFDVIGPVTSNRFSGDEAVEEAHAEAGADLVLRGHLESAGNRLSMTATLTSAPAEAEVWRAHWSERPEDLFGILGELAGQVAAAAGRPAGSDTDMLVHREPTFDVDAWRLYLEGRALLRNPSATRLQAAIDRFEAAFERDELFANPLAGIAEAYRLGHEQHLQTGQSTPLEAARAVATRAIDLDPSLPGAQIALAWCELHAWDFDAAARRLRAVIERVPAHAQAHRVLGRVLLYEGALPEACTAHDRALDLEPLSLPILNESGVPHALSGRLDVAVDRSRRVVHRDPENAMAYFHLGQYAEQADRHGEAVTYYRAAAELSGSVPWLTAFLGMALVGLGERQEAEDIANDLERKAGRGSPVATCLAVLLLRLGRRDEAVTWLASALESREMHLRLLDTAWLPIPEARQDRRLRDLLALRHA